MFNLKHLLAVLVLLSSQYLVAGDYQQPSAPLMQVLQQPKMVDSRLSANGIYLAVMTPISSPSIASLASEEVKLAGLRLAPKSLSQSRPKKRYSHISLVNLDNQEQHFINPSAGAIANVRFSPNSQYLSYIAINESAANLFLYSIKNGQTRQLNNTPLNAVFGANYQWSHDSSAILTTLAVASITEPSTTIGPNISQAFGERAPRRTYQDLLQNRQDEVLFEQLATSQLALLSLKGAHKQIGSPGITVHYKLSPNDQFILLKQIRPPYSHIVKYRDFAHHVELYSATGTYLKAFAHIDSGELRPAGADSVNTGPRLIHWRQDKPDTLAFVTALDKGDGEQEFPLRDRLQTLNAPFNGAAQTIATTPWRINSVKWTDSNTLLLTEKNNNEKKLRVSSLDLSTGSTLKPWYEKSIRDIYQHPGTLVYRAQNTGVALVETHKGKVIHFGKGASPEGLKPFLKQTDLTNHVSEPLWQSAKDKLEQVVHVVSLSPLRLVIKREDAISPPQLVLFNQQDSTEHLIYQPPQTLSAYQGMTRQLITYQRADGLPLSGMLYLPKGYRKEHGPLPLLMWAYPREYKNANVAAQVAFSANQYQSISAKGPVPFVAKGFAVFDKVSMPIVGEGKNNPNDSFRDQLVANAKAAIDTLSDMGVADPERVAIGGHSYGAFMVANLLAHSDLFKAGIARSGAYNRSLTPFGFQYEKRNYWEAPDLYQQMSPFTHADKIDEPLLIIHGEMDANSGTYPMQSTRLFNAIRGLGGKARLVMLPFESHSYVAQESLQHMLWEQEQWLKKNLQP
ncbi:peptidase S9 [Shewanella colwelliana]|uniref:S9 family peptidase n=1 Tax=Shewanella colwelliana TaxID=23 RepID=UPI001BC5C92F|nr:prolyl oligopeptidase family serine peptidase [Shewanella colwelliana]GIU21630.1 peptidase S9 [Shewanella colwelliana]